jgi:methylase of polypeptide subunit release factors
MTKITHYAHTLILAHINHHSHVIDATAGNGYDTVFLAKHAHHVTAFDIQEDAILATTKHLELEHLDNVTLLQASHAAMTEYVTQKADVIVFNLGYLPGGDKHITTLTKSTLEALNASLSLLTRGGALIITIYLGHDEGRKEAEHIETLCKTLDPAQYTVLKHVIMNRHRAPYIIEIQNISR